MGGRSASSRTRLLAWTAAVALAATGCDEMLRVTRERAPVSLEGGEPLLVAPDRLALRMPSCDADPVVSELFEGEDEVHVAVVAFVADPDAGPDCQNGMDGLEVELDRPLGDREVLDLTSGARLTVMGRPDG